MTSSTPKTTSPTETLSELLSTENVARLFYTKIAPTPTRGLDRLSPDQFRSQLASAIRTIQEKVIEGSYRFAPYLESLRLKAQGQPPRVISIPTVRDRIVLLVLKEVLHDAFPEYVARRLPNELIRSIRDLHAGDFRGSYVKADIKSFYATIEQRRLLEKLEARLPKAILRLIEKAIRIQTVTPNHGARKISLSPVSSGVPQGLAISNILAEIYIHDADVAVAGEVDCYLRYVDDIVLFVERGKEDAAEQAVKDQVVKLGLSLAPEKRHVGGVGDPFEYLGYEMRLPHISVRRVAVSRFVDSLAGLFKKFSLQAQTKHRADWLDDKARQAVFLDELNERISGAVSENRRYGWIFYFIEIDDHHLLHNLDYVVRELWLRYFGGPAPSGLKRLSRAYWEARFNQMGDYVHNYNRYSTIGEKLAFLVRRGVLDPNSESRHKPAEVEAMFSQYRARSLARLDADVGVIS